MAVIKGKLKAGDSVTGKLKEVDTEENKVTLTDKEGKEFVQPVNSITAEWIDANFDSGDVIQIGFDGQDYDVDEASF